MGAWLSISGATTNELAVAYNATYFNNDSSIIFRCVVNDERGGVTKISKIQLQASSTATYKGTVTPTERDIPLT